MQGWIIFSFPLDQESRKTGAGSRWEVWGAGCCSCHAYAVQRPPGDVGRSSAGALGLTSGSPLYYIAVQEGACCGLPKSSSSRSLSIKTRKRQFPWQWFREFRGEPHHSGGLLRDSGHEAWLWGKRTNYISDECRLLFWLEEKRRGLQEYLFGLF